MTVSIKRWIAMIAMIAMTLAGTQYQAKANDGLNSSRYGFESKEKKVDFLAAKASLSQNPFRGNSVQASIVGNSVRVQKEVEAVPSYAKIIWGGLNLERFEKNPPVTLAKRIKGELVTPNFGGHDPIDLIGSISDFGGILSDELTRSLIAGLETVERHERPTIRLKATTAGFQNSESHSKVNAANAKTTKASFSSFSSMASHRVSNSKSGGEATREVDSRIPSLRHAGAGNMHVMVFSVIDSTDEQMVRSDTPLDAFAVIRESIQVLNSIDISGNIGRAIQWIADTSVEQGIILDAVEWEEEVSEQSNDVTDDEQDFSCSLQGRLLMDSFLPDTDEQDSFKSLPSKLSVPAMMIGSKRVSKPTIRLTDSVNSAVQTAKILVKSILKVIRPMSGFEKALEIPQRLRQGMFHLDNLNWSTWRV